MMSAVRVPQIARGKLNARLSGRELREVASLDREAEEVLRGAVEVRGLSARGIVRVLRVARTCADLEGSARVGARHVAEAVPYRIMEAAPAGVMARAAASAP